MGLVTSLLQGAQAANEPDTSAIKANMYCNDDAFLESANADLIADICAINEAYLTADIIGSVKVVTEGADPVALLEAMNSAIGAKLHDAWQGFLAAVQKFFDKVITFFKSIMNAGESFAKKLGPAAHDKIKALGTYKCRAWKYDPAGGDKAYNEATSIVDKKVSEYFKDFSDIATISNTNIDKLNIDDDKIGESTDVSNVITGVIHSIDGNSSSTGDIKKYIMTKYHGGATEKAEQTFDDGDVTQMLAIVQNAKTAIAQAKQDKSAMEGQIKKIMSKCKGIGSNIEDKKAKAKAGSIATKLSQILSYLLGIYRAAAEARIAFHKESNRHCIGILRKLINFARVKKEDKAVGESIALFEDEDVDPDDIGDIDEDDVELDEAALDGADDPEGDTGDIGFVKESFGYGNDLIAEAMTFLG